MAYDPYSSVKSIYNLKGEWDNANKIGDETKKKDVADKAQQYYQLLRNNGYESVADQLQKSNYAQSKSINDKWAKMGKTSTRDYMYSLGAKYGLSSGDMDKLINWDNQTGEVSFGGKKIGTPDSVVDGVSYWSDTSLLDNAFNDYISRSGTTRSPEIAVNQENEGTFSKYKEAYDYITKTNPFTTEEAQAIMGKYDLAGLNARDNAVASGGASNGGNIDSYAAANAMRQQAALVNQGQNAVLDAHNQKIENIRNILTDMGVNIDRVFNQDQTAKNNEVARLSEQASVTGYTPEKWTYDNNIYLNSDGTVKDEFLTDAFDNSGGFTTIINNAKAKLATTTDATERANLEATIKYATQAKALKTFSSPKYEKYASEVTAVAPDKTADYDSTLKQIDSAERIAKTESENAIAIADKQYSTQLQIANLEAQTALKQIAAAAAEGDYAAGELNGFLASWNDTDTGPRNFVTNVLWEKYINNGVTPEPEILKDLIKNNTAKFNIDVEDARRICTFFDVDTGWLSDYRDLTNADGKQDVDGNLIDGQYAGMVKK